MSNFSSLILGNAALLAIGISASTVASLSISAPALTQNKFPDVDPNYWAQPFIERLAAQNIISGYPDGTFRPEQPLDRDEFAALIRDAFNQNEVRKIPSGSVFKDIPNGYWAAPAIEEAYETGFMRGFPGNLFQPQEEVSRVQALVSLANGLNLSPESPQATASATTNQATTPVTTRRVTKKLKFLPLGIIALMEPAIMASTNAQAVLASPTEPVASNKGVSSRSSTSSVPSRQNVAANRPLSSVVSNYYTDAGVA